MEYFFFKFMNVLQFVLFCTEVQLYLVWLLLVRQQLISRSYYFLRFIIISPLCVKVLQGVNYNVIKSYKNIIFFNVLFIFILATMDDTT